MEMELIMKMRKKMKMRMKIRIARSDFKTCSHLKKKPQSLVSVFKFL